MNYNHHKLTVVEIESNFGAKCTYCRKTGQTTETFEDLCPEAGVKINDHHIIFTPTSNKCIICKEERLQIHEFQTFTCNK